MVVLVPRNVVLMPTASSSDAAVRSAPVNVARLDALFADGETVDADSLVAKGVIKHNYIPVKVLGDGELTKKLTVKVDKVSASAQAKIEAAGGKVEQAC